MERKRFAIIIFFVAAAVSLVSSMIRAGIGVEQKVDHPRLQVVTSMYPLENWAEEILGDQADVTLLVRDGVEPHDFEPTTQDLIAIEQADIVLAMGAGIDPWLTDVARPKKVIVASSFASLRKDENGELDPHVWLSPAQASRMVLGIADALAERGINALAPAHFYATRELEELEGEYRSGLAECSTRSFIVSHDAFGYLADAFHLHGYPLSGLSPEAEPTPAQFTAAIERAREAANEKIGAVFTERLVSPTVAETVAAELDLPVLVLDPLEGLTREERAAGKDYLAIMRENLMNLRQGLGCL